MSNKRHLRTLSALLFTLALAACTSTSSSSSSSVVDHPDSFSTIEEKVESWLRIMTNEEKAGQMIQAERSANNGESGITPSETTSYKIGSILNGGGNVPSDNTINGWRAMAQLYRQASIYSSTGIPIIYGVDAVHGHNNVKDSTIFPHNIGLAAANNPELMREIGEVTAREVYLTGINMTFAPSIGIIKDVRWGRTYETLGADPTVAGSLIAPFIEGLQSNNIAATAKHYIGDSYTTYGTGING
jgi:beta-glucosidase